MSAASIADWLAWQWFKIRMHTVIFIYRRIEKVGASALSDARQRGWKVSINGQPVQVNEPQP